MELHTGTSRQPRTNAAVQAVNAADKQAVNELIEIITNRVIQKLDAREQHKMISNAVQQGVAKHLEQQRTAAAKAAEVDIFDNYRIDDDSAADYLNNLLEQK
jgi:hypothetical protein